MSRRRFGLAAAVALVLAGALAGCASSSSAPAGQQTDVEAAWLDDGRMIALVTPGSSTCVPTVESAELNDSGALAVTLTDPDASTACTADLAPRVTLVPVPDGVDPAEGVEIWVTGDGYYGDVDLAGVDGLAGPGGTTDYEPSAGWTEQQGQFVILTWGSSSCAPVVEESQVSGPAEVTTTFADAPADQVCTMDMAPRATLAFANGLGGVEDVQLVLTGDTFDATVPLLGVS